MRPLPAPQYKVLDHLVAGGKLLAHRVYPLPHRYHLVARVDELIGGSTPEVTAGTVASLVSKEWIAHIRPGNGSWDNYVYEITESGSKAHDKALQTQKKRETSEKGAG